VLVTLLGLWLLLSTAVLAAERRYALVIGADRGDVSDEVLRYAEQDAARFAGLLTDLAGVQPGDLILLRDPDAEQVRKNLDLIGHRMASEAGDDETMLFFYYSGHADAIDLHLAGTRLPLAELKAAVEDSPADVRLVLLDACRAGAITRLKGARPAEPFDIHIEDALDGMAILTSSSGNEDAQESEQLQGGIFTHHLVAGLQGAADTSGDHQVTLSEAYRYARARTIMTTSRAPVVQHPSYDYDIRGEGDLVLTRLQDTRRAGTLYLQQGGDYVLFDPRGSNVVIEFSVDDGGSIVVPGGEYLLRRRSPDRVDQGTIRVSEGSTTTVRGSDLDPLPTARLASRGDNQEDANRIGVVLTSGYGSSLFMGDAASASFGGGLRLDHQSLTTIARVRYSSGSEQALVDLDLAAFRLWAPTDRISLGAGGRVGAARLEGVEQVAWIGHFDLVPRAELGLTQRTRLGLEAGAGAYLHRAGALEIEPAPEANIGAEVVLYIALDISVFAF
jgi:hypothetical protein